MSISPRFHGPDEFSGALRRPDRVAGDDRRPRVGEQVRDLVGDPLHARAAGDEAVLGAALRAFLRRRHDVAAMVAGETVHQPVLDHPGGAVGALEAMPAVTAERERSEPTAVEEQQRLFATLKIGLKLADEFGREPATTRRGILRKVDGPDLGHRRARETLRQADFAIAPNFDHVTAFDRGCRRREDDGNLFEQPTHDRGVASVILDAVFLLEGRLVGFVDDDEAKLAVGQE